VTIFEFKANRAGKWFVHELAGGKVGGVRQAYASKWNAKRAAKRKAVATKGGVWREFGKEIQR